MASEMSAEVIIVGTGVVGAVIAEQLLDAGHSVLMIEAGPRVSRAEIVENFRNVPLGAKGDTSASYPPRPWAPHPVADDKPEDQYLQLAGPDSYAQTFVRYAGGSTWQPLSLPSPRFSFSTSRPPGSIRGLATSSGTCSTGLLRVAPRSC